MNTPGRRALALTQDLVRRNTVNPPGNEAAAALPLAQILEAAGFEVTLCDYAPGRPNLLARRRGSASRAGICLTGHLDTVPLGGRAWSHDPFQGETADGRLFGRGSSDMKSGIAAMVVAAVEAARRGRIRCDLILALTAAEETGCEGAAALARSGALPAGAGALVVGEPTGNRPLLGHRGVVWLEADFAGRTAHASTPYLGDNAIVKASAAVLALSRHDFGGSHHPHLGRPTLNVGRIDGGGNLNSVPDRATIGIDIRPLPGMSGDSLAEDLGRMVGAAGPVRVVADIPAVWTPPDDAWIQGVFAICENICGEPASPAAAPFASDAAFLVPAYGGVPAVILGPGEIGQAHQTDESCCIEKIETAVELYLALIDHWDNFRL